MNDRCVAMVTTRVHVACHFRIINVADRDGSVSRQAWTSLTFCGVCLRCRRVWCKARLDCKIWCREKGVDRGTVGNLSHCVEGQRACMFGMGARTYNETAPWLKREIFPCTIRRPFRHQDPSQNSRRTKWRRHKQAPLHLAAVALQVPLHLHLHRHQQPRPPHCRQQPMSTRFSRDWTRQCSNAPSAWV